MPKFIAFISGVTPPDSRIDEVQLKDCFEYLGFTNVRAKPRRVYFEYWMKSTGALTWHIKRIIKEKLNLDCQVKVKPVRKP